MKNDLATRAWQHDIGCPISITLLSTSDVLLKTSTMKYSAASWRAITAVLCICRSLFPNFSAILCTRRWKGAFLMRRSVFFWNFQISLRATAPGRQRWGFLTAIAFCVAACADFVAKWKRGIAPPVDLRAVCLVRAMVGYVWVLFLSVHKLSHHNCECTGDWETS